MRISFYCLVAVTLLALAHLGWQWTGLPDPVASHFNAKGVADGFLSKLQYFGIMAGLLVGLPAFMLGTASLSKHLPDSLVNIPNKEYWLHPDRRDSVLAENVSMLTWIACFTQLFLLVVSHLVYLANARGENLMAIPMYSSLAIYFIAIFAIIIASYIKFLRVPSND